MVETIAECLAGGGSFSAFIRVGFVGGSFLTKPASIAQKNVTDGLFVSKYTTLTAAEIGGRRIERVGVTDCAGGAELLGGGVTESAGGGELERTVTLTLTAVRPAGWLGNETLFDMLTGSRPFRGRFTARSDRGETVETTPVFADGGVTFAADFANGLRVLTLSVDGGDALTLLPARRLVTETLERGYDGEYAALAENARALVSVSAGGETCEGVGIAVPTALGAEEKLPLKFGGRLNAFGEFLVLTEADCVRVYGAEFGLLASRSGEGIVDCSVSASGAFAFADKKRIRVCRGGADLCALPVTASSVALIESGGGLRLHYLAGGRLTGVDIADGKPREIYSVSSDCFSIVDRGRGVLGVAPGYSRYYGADGALLVSHTIGEGNIEQVTGKSRGLFLLKTTTRSWLVGPFAQTGLAGAGKALCGRAALTEIGGKTSLVRLGAEADETVCELAADDAAFADRLYYRRGESLYCRSPLGSALRIVADAPAGSVVARISADGDLTGPTRASLTLALG